MSFDLIVWDASNNPPTTLEEADQRDEDLAELFSAPLGAAGERPVPGERMLGLVARVEDMLGRLSAGEGGGFWATPPAVGDDFVVMTFSRSIAVHALNVLKELCSDSNIVFYDPQSGKLYRPGGGSGGDEGELICSDGTVVCRPTDATIMKVVRSVSNEDWFVTLDLGARFVQVGLGVNAGMSDGVLSLEVRESDTTAVQKFQVTDLQLCVDVFLAFRRNDPKWRVYFVPREE
ncbi:hypothetical protein ABT369_55970 [Dactylosporangium sp. NPDC000244]|uniref:hypothetical protein n=1 Tax=Dactylosporangium sp. NPDC000244 TaxID=3154365 RepID=UPI00331ED2C4